MNGPIPLDYAKGHYGPVRPFSIAAIIAFIVGLISGPAGIALALLGQSNNFAESTKETIGEIALIVCQGAALAFAAFVYIRLRRPDRPRGRGLAMGGIIAAFLWAILIVAAINYAENHP
ncbi:MAG: hypothetical protein ABSH08_08545 [Tepidisphaeraceae bacterium]